MDFFKKNTTSRYPTDILIGELFVKAAIISQKQLDDTVRSAGAKHLHIGQMLVMSGFIKQRDIECAVDAQSLLRDKVVDMTVAARCLRIAVKTGASVMELVKEEQAQGQASTQTNRLGELLMEAGLINRGQLSAAMQRSMSTGLPLGRILVLNNSIVDPLLRFALELQVRVRDEMIDRAEAIEALRAEATGLGMKVGYYDASPNDSAINLKPLKQKVVRLGELLVSAQFLNETDVMSCLELGLLTERPIGEVMVEQGYISSEMLHVALTVQQMVEERVYTKEEAGEALIQIRETGNIVPLVQDRLDGRYKTGSYTTLRESLPPPLAPGEIYDEMGFDQQSDTIAPGTLQRSDYDVDADLKEFNAVAGSAKTGRHSSARKQDSPPAEPRESHEAHEPHEPVATASNFEEAPSLESLMAGFGGDSADSNGEEVGDGEFAAGDSEFVEEGHDNGNGSASVVASPVAPTLAANDQFETDTTELTAAVPLVTPAPARAPAPTRAPASTPPPPPPPTPTPAHPFEALLLTAKVVSVKDIEHAFDQVRTNPLLLAEMLQQTGFLTTVGRTAALDCFNLITTDQFDHMQGAQILDHCINQGRLRNLTLNDSLSELGIEVVIKEGEAESADTGETDAVPTSSIDASQGAAADAEEVAPIQAAAPAELVIDSLIAEVTVEAEAKAEPTPKPKAEPKAEPKDEDLLKLFGLNEGTSVASDEAVAKSAQTASTAESLMASLLPPTEAAAATEEAATARPEAFQTTAVFKSIADEELDRASSMVIDEGSSLDSLLTRLEGNLTDAGDEPELATFGADSLTNVQPESGLTQSEPTPDFASYVDSEDASNDLLLDRLNDMASKGNGAESNTNEFAKKPTEEVDLRSLFSSLTVDASPKGGAAKPMAASGAPKTPEKSVAADNSQLTPASMTPAVAPELPTVAKTAAPAPADAAPTPIAPASAGADGAPTPTPAVPPLPSGSAPTSATAAPSSADTAATTAAPDPGASAVPVSATPAKAEAEPAPTASAAPSPARVPAAKSRAGASHSKLPTMSDQEIYAAKMAQIGAMASALTKMAEMHYEAANYPEAQKAYERILSWRQGELGAHHIDLVDDLNNLAGVMCVQESFDQAEPMIRRAVEILENAERLEPLRLADNLTSLAGLQFRLGVFEKAEPLLARSLMLREQELGAENTDLADALRDYAKLLKKLGKLDEAEKYYSRAKVLIARRKAEEEPQ